MHSRSKIVLPLMESYQLRIIGGSGSYRYQIPSSDSSLLTLSLSGLIYARGDGKTVITVID